MNNKYLNENLNKILLLLFAIIFKICLDYFYYFIISPLYDYEGLVLEMNLQKYIFSWILFAFIYFFILRIEEICLKFIIHLEFIISILPLMTFYALGNKSNLYLIYISICFFIQILIFLRNNKMKYSIYIKGIKKHCTYFLSIFITFVIIKIFFENGFHGLKAFDLNYLYEIRNNTKFSPLFGYCIMWTRITFIPFFIIYNFFNKKYIKSLVFVALQLLLYTGTGDKFSYLILIVILSVYIISQKNYKEIILYTGNILMILLLILYKLKIIISFYGERFFFIPTLNKFLYYDFFSHYPKLFFSDGILGKTLGITNPYIASSGQLVYAYLFKGRLFESNSVTGYLGDGYAQLGFLGMILFSLLKGWLFRFIILTTNGVSNKIRISILTIFIIMLNDVGLLTTIFSGGLFLITLLFYIYQDQSVNHVIFLEYKIRDFIEILLKCYKKILLTGFIFSLLSIVISKISYNKVISDYAIYILKNNNIDFIKSLFKTSYKEFNLYKLLFSSFLIGTVLSSNFFILKNIQKKINE